MHIRLVFRGMDHSKAIEDYVNQEIEHKVLKFLKKEGDLLNIDAVLDAGRIHAHHHVEIRLKSTHYHFIASYEGADLYTVIDHVIKIIVEDIKKHKDRSIYERNHIPKLSIDSDNEDEDDTK